MNKIGIIGLGFVGKSINKSFNLKNIETEVYDKYKNIGTFNNILYTKFLFLCLPTPFEEISCKYNIEEIIKTLEKLVDYKGLIILKSTVEPETTNKLSDKFRHLKICHNPEFLTARTAFEDFHNQTHIVLGRT